MAKNSQLAQTLPPEISAEVARSRSIPSPGMARFSLTPAFGLLAIYVFQALAVFSASPIRIRVLIDAIDAICGIESCPNGIP